MKSILFYISDHGYGHASRIIAIIKELLEREERLRIYVRSSYAFNFIKNSIFSNRLFVNSDRNDFGVLYKDDGYTIDEEKTLNLIRLWLKNKRFYLKKEKNFCIEKNIDLIISDIPPFPFDVGKDLSIPTIALSNFNWYTIYKEFAKSSEDRRCIEEIKKSYQKADYAFVLPFHCGGMDIFDKREEFPLIARRKTMTKEEVYQRLKIKEDQKLIYISFGFSVFNEELIENLRSIRLKKGYTLLLSSRVTNKLRRNIVSIPKDDKASHNYIAACDLAVIKVGFSTVSECISSSIPLVLVGRRRFVEDYFTINTLLDVGIAKEISMEEFIGLSWIKNIEEYLALKENYKKLPSFLYPDGAQRISERILKILGDI
jgi:uncharacterized protein (TIGR00661 family)